MFFSIEDSEDLTRFCELSKDELGLISEIKFLSTVKSCRTFDGVDDEFGKFDAALFHAFCKVLAQCEALHSIDFQGNNLWFLDVACFQALGDMFAQCKLRSINLSACKLVELELPCFQALCNALAQNKELHSIDLRNNELNKLDVARIQALGDMFAQCKLRSINLSYNNFGFTSGVDLIQAFWDALAQNKELSSIDLSENFLCELGWDTTYSHYSEDVCFQALCKGLTQFKKLSMINLRYNSLQRFGVDRIQELVVALAQSQELCSIDLSNNNFYKLDDDCIQALCGMFAYKLQSINLSSNGLGRLNVGRKALWGALAHNQELRSIDLSDNYLGRLEGTCFNAICEALRKCRSLVDIKGIDQNNLSAERELELENTPLGFTRRLMAAVSALSGLGTKEDETIQKNVVLPIDIRAHIFSYVSPRDTKFLDMKVQKIYASRNTKLTATNEADNSGDMPEAKSECLR